jgi:hypothetical protein
MVSILASGSDTARSRRCRCRDLIPTVDGSSVTGVEVVDPRWEPWSPAEVARRLADVDAGQRAWLREALARVAPAHEWARRV